MAPRKTTDLGALFENLVEDLRIQVATSVEKTLGDMNKRLSRIERRLELLDPEYTPTEPEASARGCALCDRPSIAKGLCSSHYQQWRYRERRNKIARANNEEVATVATPLRLVKSTSDLVHNN